MMLTELQKIGLVYESINDPISHRLNADDLRVFGFTNDFDALGDNPPYGFWVCDDLFMPVNRGRHTSTVSNVVWAKPEYKKELMRLDDSLYQFAYKALKWVRIVIEGRILYYSTTTRSQISNSASRTIRDLSIIWDLVPQYEEDKDVI